MSIKTQLLSIAIAGLLTASFSAQAINTLQVGAPDGSGGYVNYTASSTNPTEQNTAIIGTNTILFAGVTGQLQQGSIQPTVLNLGGQYGTGSDWTGLSPAFPSAFGGAGAVAMMTVEQGKGASAFSAITLSAINAFYWADTFALFPNNHAPTGDGAAADYVFFDIGDFVGSTLIPNFVDETTGNAYGEIKSFTLGGTLTNFAWLHFDVMALATDTQGQTNIVTTLENNPGSHDVTWKNPGCTSNCGGGGGGGQGSVPEPSVVALLGMGLLGMGLSRRTKA